MKHVKTALCALLCLAMILPLCATTAYAARSTSYNLYASPDLSGTSGVFDTFSIDFRSKDTPAATFWALGNFNLYLSPETKELYGDLSGGGAFAGLQVRNSADDKVGILSIWDMNYTGKNGERKTLHADRMYPEGGSSAEGAANYIGAYAWKDGVWYRMVLHTWEDEASGTTFVGMWLCDFSTGAWTLYAYFDTHLVKSAMTGAMNFFQENYLYTTGAEVRSYNLKNIYALDASDKEWKSLPGSNVSYNYYDAMAAGRHEFGVDSDGDGEFFWGIAGGSVADQSAYNASNPGQSAYTIEQPESPTFGEPVVESLNAEALSNISWTLSGAGTPQLSYKIVVTDAFGNELQSLSGTRPEVRGASVSGVETDAYKCELTVTDIFGKETTKTYTTPRYDELVGGGPDPEILYGDVNGDGRVSKKDSLDLKKYLADSDYEIDQTAADVNCDGDVNKKDSLRLKQYLAGWEVALGPETSPANDTNAAGI